MDCVDLEDLCSRALKKLGLELVPTKNKDGTVAYWQIGIKRRGLFHRNSFVDYSCGGSMLYGAIAASIEEVANMLFNLYDKELNALYWKTFHWIGNDGNSKTAANIFAGKSLYEVEIMLDLA